jgi:hypothetical protein
MSERALRGLGRRGVSAPHRPLDEGRQTPGPCEAVSIVDSFEDRHRPARKLEDAVGVSSGPAEEADVLELEPGAELEAALAAAGAAACGLGENALGPPEVAGAAQGDAQLAHQLEPEGVVFAEERRGAAEKIDGRRRVAAPPRLESRGTEAKARGHCKPGGATVGRIEVGAAACRLLEMVSHQLVLSSPDQVGDALVQLGAFGLGQGCVGDLPHEDVVEPETCGRGLDESRLHRPLQERVDRRGQLGRGQARENVRRELAADERRPLQQPAFPETQPVEAGREQRLDRGRNGLQGARLAGVGEQLLGVERVPLGDGDDPGGELRVGAPAEGADKLVRLFVVEPLQRDRPAGHRAQASGVRPSETEDQDRGVEPVAEMLDEVEKGRLGPVDVLEHEHRRPFAGHRSEEAPQGGELDTRRGGAPDDRLELSACLSDHVGHREIGSALTVGDTAADEDGRLASKLPNQLACEPGLTDPGLTHHRR